jgi:hypothetical protein
MQITVTDAVAVCPAGHPTVAPQAFAPTGPEDTTEQAALLTPTPPPVAWPEEQLTCPFAFEPAGTEKSWLFWVRRTPSEPFEPFLPFFFFFALLIASNPGSDSPPLSAAELWLAREPRPSKVIPAAPMPASERTALRRPDDVTGSEPVRASLFEFSWAKLNESSFLPA